MNMFELILSPFIFIIKQLFLFGYHLTGNYGWAIILLSFFISLLLLPVFVYIEKAKKKTDTVKRKMQPLVDEIKRCYKGQERYYYLKTLNRQHGYSPLKAMIPILSLLLQIPFFIAAYQYLEHFEALQGVSFGFIKDLSQPDGLLGAVNILPIAMTVVNLITAWFYTRNGNTSERKQMLIVALAFLILLFKLPSGLVLYWTMNNVFSFFRLFVTNPEVFKKRTGKEEIRQRVSFLNFIKETILQIKVKPYIYYSLLFLSIYFYLAARFYYSGINTQLAVISAIFLIPLQFIGFSYFLKSKTNIIIWNSTLLILIILSSTQLLNFTTMALSKGFELSFFSITLNTGYCKPTDFVLPGIIFSFITTIFYYKKGSIILPDITNKNILFAISALYISGFIFLWNPLITFATFPDAFEYQAIDIIQNNFIYFVVTFLLLLSVYALTPRKYKRYSVVLIVSMVIIFFANNTLIPVRLGTLQINKYSEEWNLAAPVFRYFIDSIIIISALGSTIFFIRKKYFKEILIFLLILNSVLIFQSLYKSLSSGNFFRKIDRLSNVKHTITLSKSKNNYIYFIPDMFQGWSINKILSEEPELKKKLSGFVWYPNTLSVSRVTNTSMPALLGGFECVPDKLDADTLHTIKQKMTNIVKNTINKAKNLGCKTTLTKLPYTEMDSIDYDMFLPYWHSDWDKFNSNLNIEDATEDGFEILIDNAILYSVPLFIKPKIYNYGTWFAKYKKKSTANINTWIAKKYNFLRLLPYISSANSNKSNFIVIYSFATHFPWNYIDKNGALISDVSPYKTDKWTLETFSEWIDWMKRNDVYDNTRIVIVSDHGIHWKRYKGEIDIDIPFRNINEEKVSLEWMLNLNPLLLVKDFDSKGDLQKNMQFMSNTDAYSILFGENRIIKDSTQVSRVLRGYISWWTKDLDNRKKFSIYRSYKVKDNIFDTNNWEME